MAIQTSPTAEILTPLRVARLCTAAEGISAFELVHPRGELLPAFTAGAHIKVQVPNGLVRKYSLCNDPSERNRYLIAVKREADGRGGSASLVDGVKEGDLLPTSLPDNAFPLASTAGGYLFIAGGIGITPILSMIRSFGELPQAPWKLYYFTRSPACTAFLAELTEPSLSSNVVVHHDYGDPARSLDLWPVLERPTGAHIYCCGPRGLMEAVRDMTGHWPHSQVHFESFSDGGAARADDRPFVVKLARSGRTLEVPVGANILEVLRKDGLSVPSSCESGTCGTCKTRLLAGEADHRDMVLLPEELGSWIMICVSRAKSGELELDL